MNEQYYIYVNVLIEVYKELLPECICKNWNNEPYMLAVTGKKWALDKAMKICEGQEYNSVDILTSYLWELMILKMDTTNPKAKIVFGHACKIIQEMIDLINYKLKI